jgi:hypothetical protein
LAAYDSNPNPLYYAMRFVDGLKKEIKSVVMIQRPANLDSACALSLVQEEACDSGKRKIPGGLIHSTSQLVGQWCLCLNHPNLTTHWAHLGVMTGDC